MSILLTEGYFENLYPRFLEESILFLLALNCPASTQRSESFGRNVPDHTGTEIGRIRFFTNFGSTMSDIQLESRKIEKNP